MSTSPLVEKTSEVPGHWQVANWTVLPLGSSKSRATRTTGQAMLAVLSCGRVAGGPLVSDPWAWLPQGDSRHVS